MSSTYTRMNDLTQGQGATLTECMVPRHATKQHLSLTFGPVL